MIVLYSTLIGAGSLIVLFFLVLATGFAGSWDGSGFKEMLGGLTILGAVLGAIVGTILYFVL